MAGAVSFNEVEGILLNLWLLPGEVWWTPEHQTKKTGSPGRPLGSSSGVVQISPGQELTQWFQFQHCPALSETLSRALRLSLPIWSMRVGPEVDRVLLGLLLKGSDSGADGL